METIEEMAERHKKERDSLLVELNHAAKAERLGLRPKYIHPNIWVYPCWSFEAKNFGDHFTPADLVKTLEQIPPAEEYWYRKDTFTEIKPRGFFKDDPSELGSLIAPVVLTKNKNYVQAEWVAEVDGHKVLIHFKYNDSRIRQVPVRNKPHPKSKIVRWDLVHPFPLNDCGQARWSTGGDIQEYPNDFTIFFQPWVKIDQLQKMLGDDEKASV